MQIKCEYCGSFIDETEEKCPSCGATNSKMVRAAHGVPRTIEELQAFCDEHRVDLEKMHFHIGEDYRLPKALGIYRDGDEFIVYKNKGDGSRAVRYRGTDEGYAVNELYQKLKTELQEVREQSSTVLQPSSEEPPPRDYTPTPVRSRRKIGCLTWLLIIFIGIPLLLGLISLVLQKLGLYTPSPAEGYYFYGGQEYQYVDDQWYAYSDNIGWYSTEVDPDLAENYHDYWDRGSDSDHYDYDDDNNWDDDWDDDDWDDDSYDYDSWDAGNDWDSDW